MQPKIVLLFRKVQNIQLCIYAHRLLCMDVISIVLYGTMQKKEHLKSCLLMLYCALLLFVNHLDDNNEHRPRSGFSTFFELFKFTIFISTFQGTCLSILNDLLQTESEHDYSMAVTNVPIEPLLSILEKDAAQSKKLHSEKLQLHQERTPIVHGENPTVNTRKTAHHIHFQEKDAEVGTSKSLKREPKFILEKRLSEKEIATQGLKLVDVNSHIHFIPLPDGVGRGRSDSFSSQSSRESSPSSMGKISSKSNSVSDVRLGEGLASGMLRQRRSSRGSGYSTDASTARLFGIHCYFHHRNNPSSPS